MEKKKILNSKKKYKILMVIPRYSSGNKKSYDYLLFPLGIAYISACLKKAGHEIRCLNLNHLDGNNKKLIERELDKEKYDFVCTGGNALAYNMTYVILKTAKEHITRPKTILGGPMITSEPELIFNDLRPDFAIIGEADEAIAELLDYIQKNKELKKVKGLLFWEKDKAVFTGKREPPMDVDSIPFPDLDILGYEDYLNNLYPNMVYFTTIFENPRVYYLLGSRSCPYQCTFCYHDNNRYRPRSIKNIMDELNERVKKYKINRIYVFDECFAISKDRLYEFCREIKKLKESLPWELRWMSSLRVSEADQNLLETMKEAGCDVIGYGFESHSLKVLQSMKKNITPEQIDNAFKETLKAGISIQGNFIFGDVAETKETAYETLNWWKKSSQGQIHLDFIYPYPKSEVYLHCVRKGIIKNRLKFIKDLMVTGSPVINTTDKMSDKEIKRLNYDILKALAKYRKAVVPFSMEKVKENRYNLKARCPYCNKIVEYKNCYISDTFSYSFNALCRHCPMRFYVASSLRKFAYKNFHLIKGLKDFKSNIINYVRRISQR